MSEETSSKALPSATGFAARQATAVLRKHNAPVASLLERAGISESDIEDRQRRISAMAQGKLLEYASEALGDNEFGLHLAEQANPREAGLLRMVAEVIASAVASGLSWNRNSPERRAYCGPPDLKTICGVNLRIG